MPFFFSAYLDAYYPASAKNPLSYKAKITAAQSLRLAYLSFGAAHVYSAINCAINHFYDHSPLKKLLKRIAGGILFELGGAYSSFFSLMALSCYIKKLKGCKVMSDDLGEVPSQFNYESDEDIDKVIIDTLLHAWAVFSSLAWAYKTGKTYQIAYNINNPEKQRPKNHPTDPDRVLTFSEKLDMAKAPVFIPAQLYTAYYSTKAIFSKINNVIKNYKRELPKYNLGNSNGFLKSIN